MALSGNLEELAVVDVIQFANQAHLSGCLLLRQSSEEAELFYRKGGLVHARLGANTGIEVLVRIVDWSKGEFEFRAGIDAAEETIRMDLHRAVMHALKTRDERRAEEERKRAEETAAAAAAAAAVAKAAVPGVREILQELVESVDFVQQLALFDAGALVGSAARKNSPAEDLEALSRIAAAGIDGYPRGGLKRAILDDEKGTVILSQVPGNRWLLVLASRGATLGAITVGMGKLIARLHQHAAQSSNAGR